MPDQTQGMWPAIWFLPGVSGTPNNELDGYEGGWPGIDPDQMMHSNYFSVQGQQQNTSNLHSDVSAGFHTYGFQFIPGQSLTAYFDGWRVWQVDSVKRCHHYRRAVRDHLSSCRWRVRLPRHGTP